MVSFLINLVIWILVLQTAFTFIGAIGYRMFTYAFRLEHQDFYNCWQRIKWEWLWRLDGSEWDPEEAPNLMFAFGDCVISLITIIVLVWCGGWVLPFVAAAIATLVIRWFTGRSVDV